MTDPVAQENLESFRNEVRAFLTSALTPELRAAAAGQAGVFSEGEVARQWHRILYERGWIAPAWPREYGGPGWSPVQRMTFEHECANAGAPTLPAMGLQMCGPVLIGHGTQEQRDYFLPRILSGEHFWCQGYSEPQAGSDLSALRCAAVRDGDDYVVNGTKIWTTHAQYANWIFLLVRTDPTSQRGAGISFLLAPMDSPGITVRPILSMSGEHEVNQLFFDDVRIPVANRVGAENDGWRIAKYLLEFERGGGAAGGRVARVVRRLYEAEASAQGVDAARFHDPDFIKRRAEIEIELMALEMTQYRSIAASETGRAVGDAAASTFKLVAATLFQKATELAMDVLGPAAAIDQRAALEGRGPVIGPDYAAAPTARYLNARAMTVFGGTSEIQRGILAKAALGI
ncbi:acyl-CoA dehydrogenase [Sphingobium lactosutens]|uniref:acyl-CoA dehydrogenase family protein n=1 Tax=Sphingobium lactosutens TaxID=522773 RepID=UPI0015C14945|nr:acyl-CoA dehydrogenase family protein [Sphingobium lactosutens]NWK98739.1 acyl-CoA dehydrogenase [Sphingobium lactosutens]